MLRLSSSIRAVFMAGVLSIGWMIWLLPIDAQAAEPTERKPAGGRKVIVGTLMFNMFHEYPGLDKRLEELGAFIDQMASAAKAKYPDGQLDIAALPEMAVNGNAKGSAAEISLPIEGRVDIASAVDF